MTQAQWQRVVGFNPSYYRPGTIKGLTELHPVESVSWNHATRALARIGMTLAHEYQWEHVCRAGTETPWWTGRSASNLSENENLADLNYHRNGGGDQHEKWSDGYSAHAPVHAGQPNPWGFHQMHGNVCEWCSNVPYLHVGERLRRLGGVDESEDRSARMARAGCYSFMAKDSRASARRAFEGHKGEVNIGVRPARSIAHE